MNSDQSSGASQGCNNIADELCESFRRIAEWASNCYPLEAHDERGRALQGYALSVLPRFRAAALVDLVCHLFGWRLVGPGVLEVPGEYAFDEYVVDRSFSLEWLHPAGGDHEVRFELGDEPLVLVRWPGVNDWCEVEGGAWGLLDVLGDWSESLGVRP